MDEKVLSDGEMDALMDASSSESQAVLRAGTEAMADVRSFEVQPHCHLSFGSYPELQRLNDRFALSMQRFLRQTLNWSVSCVLQSQTERALSERLSHFSGLQHVMGFRLDPLAGPFCFLPDPQLTCALVEVYFGSVTIPPADPTLDEYSNGQKRMAQRFANEALALFADVWKPLATLTPAPTGSWASLELAEIGGVKDPVIASEFLIEADDFKGRFAIVMPTSAIGDYADLLDGADRPGDSAQDTRWRTALLAHVTELNVTLNVCNAPSRLSLAELRAISAGDRLSIAPPNPVAIRCGDVALYHGHFGVNERRRCVQIDGAVNA